MLEIRSAKPQDADLIYQFIRDKAEFDRGFGYLSTVQTTVAKIQQTLFSDCPFAHESASTDCQR